MDEQRDNQLLDTRLSLILLIEDLEIVLLHSSDRKPADPVAWEAFSRIDKLRRELQRDAGQDPTEIDDPFGRVSYAKEKEGGE